MDSFSFSDNLAALRHAHSLTQQQVADQVHVTKASVSKWENGQALPDLQILVRLASLFDVTLDALLGYVPRLSPEQIENRHQRWCAGFAAEPFSQVFAQIQEEARSYWHDWVLLCEISLLLLNHLPSAGPERSAAMDYIFLLTGRICENCADRTLQETALQIRSLLYMMDGQPQEAARLLEAERALRQVMLLSNDLLIQSLVQKEEPRQAASLARQSLFLCLHEALEQIRTLLYLEQDPEGRRELEQLADLLITDGGMQQADPSLVTGILYSGILQDLHSRQPQKAALRMERLADCLEDLNALLQEKTTGPLSAALERPESLHGLPSLLPRDPVLIWQDVLDLLSSPALLPLHPDSGWKRAVSLAQEYLHQAQSC